MEAWKQVLFSRLHVELDDDESEEDFLLLSLFVGVISKVVRHYHGGSKLECIFCYFTIGYLKILYLKLFFTIIGYFTLGYSKLLYLWLFYTISF
jgi:hypothetical protein